MDTTLLTITKLRNSIYILGTQLIFNIIQIYGWALMKMYYN